jgi:uncharacterized protein
MMSLKHRGAGLENLEAAIALVQPSVPFDVNENLVAAFRIGSHSHGTHVPPEDPNGIDDTDYMLIVCPPVNNILGLRQFEGAQVQRDGLDVVVYEWGKWLRLLLKQNPNVVGTLWLDPEDRFLPGIARLPELEKLFVHRHLVLSRGLYKSFIGYANGQMYKMTHHLHQGYMGAKRTQLVEKYGYDVKNAAHMIRLLRMAIEALQTGEMQVRRPDASEIIEIKQGKWSLEQVLTEAKGLAEEAESAVQGCRLQEHPEASFIEYVITDGYLSWWGY